MGNTVGRLTPCLCPAAGTGDISRRHDFSLVVGNPFDDGLGHSFCYVRPDHFAALSSSSSSSSSSSLIAGRARDRVNPRTALFFRTISGASISANTSTPLSTTLYLDAYLPVMDRASSFESSPSFASVPLQPIPRGLMVNSGPLPARNSGSILGSGPIERGFLSGPIERGFASGPIDHRTHQDQVCTKSKYKFNKWGSIKGIKDSILASIWGPGSGKEYDSSNQTEWENSNSNLNHENVEKSSSVFSGHMSGSLCEENDGSGGYDCGGAAVGGGLSGSLEGQNLQWAQGKAGEDRVHIVVSEDQGWVFVGIYDGFNGPDAPDFLLSNFYSALHEELKGLMQVWNARLELESESESISASNQSTISKDSIQGNRLVEEVEHYLRRYSGMESTCSGSIGHEFVNGDQGIDSNSNHLMKKQKFNGNGNGNGIGNMLKSNGTKAEKLGYTLDKNKQILELDERIREKISQMGPKWSPKIRHSEVMKALSEALRKTEESYLDIADKMVKENPELCLMGSCVLVMLMMGEDIYLMNVGDSRAVIGQKSVDLDFIDDFPNVSSLQLTMDHNTYVKEEVKRIQNKHLDDPSAVVNHRVKGSLKVTRAFGAGFLKQPKWNEALLESFRIDYVGSLPYITCRPSLSHHSLGPRDKFLILSSDGLYQYFTNDEAVSEVELFMASTPEGDPAQHLIEEVLFRAAKGAGMDFHELLEIPQGERRRYHDDVSVIVISLEGTIWRSSV